MQSSSFQSVVNRWERRSALSRERSEKPVAAKRTVPIPHSELSWSTAFISRALLALSGELHRQVGELKMIETGLLFFCGQK